MINSKSGKTLVNRIVKNGGKELSGYENLSQFKKIELFVELWKRLIYSLLTTKSTKSKWGGELQKKDFESIKETFGEYPNQFILKGKNSADKALALVTVTYNEENDAFLVEHHVMAKDIETRKKYEKILESEIADIERIIKNRMPENLFIKTFFDVLSDNRVCDIPGSEALIMKRLLEKAPKHFPEFGELMYYEKINILRDAFRVARREHKSKRDQYTFARATFEEMFRAGVVHLVYKHDPISGKMKMYRAIGYSFNTISRPNGAIPRFIDFAYDTNSGVVLRTSMLCFDLWELLAKNGNEI